MTVEPATLPCSFDVIDTSNLADFLGVINLLLATCPLLKPKSYSLIQMLHLATYRPSQGDMDRFLQNKLGMDLPTVSLLFGVAPTDW